MPPPKITFGVIVLNGEPFTRYCLRSLYPFAHEIIVAEGAAPNAAASATSDGHSVDGTLDVLREFQRAEDPENKLKIITAEDCGHPDGFWPAEKDEQSQAYASRASGSWLWQVDIDEFYTPEAIGTVMDMLQREPKLTAVSFPIITFWADIGIEVNGLIMRSGGQDCRRLFRYGPGYRYLRHRPPTVIDSQGRHIDGIKWFRGRRMRAKGVWLYHYGQLFPEQVLRKCAYYEKLSPKAKQATQWAEKSYCDLGSPFRVHRAYRHVSWLEAYDGPHPPQIIQMMSDIKAGRVKTRLRPNEDAQVLLASKSYAVKRALLKLIAPLYGFVFFSWSWRPPWVSRRWLRKVFSWNWC
jgi:hypothetical protein